MNSQTAAFILYDTVQIYGGFNGTEAKLSDRKKDNPATILSAKSANGSYNYPHVIYGADNTILDSLVISDGRATASSYNGKGGGLIAYAGGTTFLPFSPPVGFKMTINNCVFTHNQAIEGGAIYAFGKATLDIKNTKFDDNTTQYGGTIMDREGNQINCIECNFVHNQAKMDGGAVYVDYGSHSKYQNSVFNNNLAGNTGAAVYIVSRASQLGATKVLLDNNNYQGNHAKSGKVIVNEDQSEVTITGKIPVSASLAGKLNLPN